MLSMSARRFIVAEGLKACGSVIVSPTFDKRVDALTRTGVNAYRSSDPGCPKIGPLAGPMYDADARKSAKNREMLHAKTARKWAFAAEVRSQYARKLPGIGAGIKVELPDGPRFEPLVGAELGCKTYDQTLIRMVLTYMVKKKLYLRFQISQLPVRDRMPHLLPYLRAV
jgi:hypothetical protein